MRSRIGPIEVGGMTLFGALAVAVVICACNAPALATSRGVAKEARTVHLVERARLKLSSEKGATITEHGRQPAHTTHRSLRSLRYILNR
jgi:hypothetical protein